MMGRQMVDQSQLFYLQPTLMAHVDMSRACQMET
jgi:hypothetical protein